MMKYFLFAALVPATMFAQTMELTQQLEKTVLYGDVALSPDGNSVAWVQSTAATTIKELHLVGTSGKGKPTKVNLAGAADTRKDYSPAWSPDSKSVVFFSTAGEKDEQRQLWIVNADASSPKKLTSLNGYAARPRWSRDGSQIAFLFVEGGGGGGPLVAAEEKTGVIDTAFHNQRIAVIDAKGGQPREVSPPDLHIYDFDWSPDGQSFVVTAAPGPGDNNWWIAKIHTISIAKGTATSVYKPVLQVAVPRWSPDGKSIAFVEGLMSDEGNHGGDLWTMAADGSGLTNRTKGRKSSPGALFWLEPDRILLTEAVGGSSAVSELSLADNSVRTIWKGAEDVSASGNFPNFSVANDGKMAALVRSDYSTPPEVWTGPIGKWSQLTEGNNSIRATWGKAESLEWRNDNFNIQGWLIPPAKSEQGRKHPMVVLIHGGPSSVSTPEWPAGFGMSRAVMALLSQRGYYVFLPNPRGSYGQGEEFARANVKDFGGGDLRDILAGIDAAIAKYPIDPNRLGVMGWSYGGFMTMWTVTQTNRFGAAVAGAGIANWQSYYGQNLIDQWMIPFFGASVYDDPSVYEKSSPIHFIKNVKTPTLVVVGERDAECPAPQSYEFWHALRTLKVPTRLIVYPGEGHMFVDPKHQRDRLDQTLSWFDEHLLK